MALGQTQSLFPIIAISDFSLFSGKLRFHSLVMKFAQGLGLALAFLHDVKSQIFIKLRICPQPRLINGVERWIHPVQILINEVQRLINGVQILINGVQILINGVQILINGAKILINGVQILINGVQILINGVQILINGAKILINGAKILILIKSKISPQPISLFLNYELR
ncbi:hypothetical protein [Nostoc sp.]|uniref:hypothetical protein n=1 Tax=Nostoc sp. TaxID=1180 RepID=UPI002FFB1CB8